MKIILLIMLLLLLTGGTVMSQTPKVWLDAADVYSQRDTSFVIMVHTDQYFTGVKALRVDIDVDSDKLSFDTTSSSVIDDYLVKPGALFDYASTISFFKAHLSADSTRLTVDIAMLQDSATVDGPGELIFLPVTTVGFGESYIEIAGVTMIDRFGNNLPVDFGEPSPWVKVCRYMGDLNGDNRLDIADLVFFVDYSFRDGPAPVPREVANINCDNEIDIGDLVMFVDYQFRGGPPPCEVCL